MLQRPTADAAPPIPLRFLLRFDDAGLEQRFVRYCTSFYFRQAQASLVLGVLLLLGDYLVDYWANPDLRANLFRLALCVPLLLLTLAYSLHPHARRHWEPVMSAFIVLVSGVLFWILLEVDAQGGHGLQSWVGVLNFTILELYCFVILGARFRTALVSGVMIFLGFEGAMLWRHWSALAEAAYLSYHAFTMMVIAAGMGWWRELLLRQNFAFEVFLEQVSDRLDIERSTAQATLEATDNGILVLDQSGKIVAVNNRFRTMWGIPEDWVVHQDDAKIIEYAVAQLEQRDKFLRNLQALNAQPEAVTRDTLPLRDGRVFARFSHPHRLGDAIIGRVWSFLDITEQRRAEERILQLSEALTLELAQSERQRGQLQALLRAMPDQVWMKDTHGVYLSCNRAFEVAVGKSLASILGKTDADLFPGDDLASYRADDLGVLAGTAPVVREQWATHQGSGQRVLLEIFKAPVRSTDDSLVGVLGVARDVTRMRSLVTELESARAQALQSNEAKSLFLANMSHEIRTPMNAIIGMTDLVLDTELNPRQRNYAGKIRRASDALLHIINDILDFSKIEAGKLHVESVPFEMEDVLEQLSSVLALRAENQGIELAYALDDGLPDLLVGDPFRLGQVLTNLVSNALKFSSRGNVVVSVKLATIDTDRAVLQFSVSDQGIGLTAQQIAHIFDPFTQADASTTRQYGGTGLGLAICQHLVGLLGGRIWVESVPGEGSTFHFTAQFARATDRRRSEVARVMAGLQEKVDLADHPVLIVDDNPLAVRILEHCAQRMGLRSICAASGEAALELVQRMGAPEFLACLVDWYMPTINGIDTMRLIRDVYVRLGKTAPPMILVTAHVQDEGMAAVAHYMDGLLAKPASVRRLAAELASVYAIGLRNVPHAYGRKSDGLNWVRFQRLDILVVEDMEINQDVITELLRGVGLHTRVAANGVEALREVARKKPDLILMDCQMPVMDGYAATRQLRSDPATAKLPIVALTASAMADEYQHCMSAGMNGFVAKPIRLDLLYEQLAQCVPVKVLGSMADTSTGAPAEVPAQLPAIDGVDLELGLAHVGGSAESLFRVLQKFRDKQCVHFENEFRQAVVQQDWVTAERQVHSLKGIARTLGATALAEQVGTLETALKDRNEATVAQAIDQVGLRLRALHQALRGVDELLEAAPTTETHTPLPARLRRQHIERLKTLLRDRDTEAIDHARALLHEMEGYELRNQWRDIIAQIERYDFLHAEQAVQQILIRDLGTHHADSASGHG